VFRRVLIANRGEIALRIARACRTVKVSTVGVFSEADRDAPWLDDMDERVCIGPARAEASYLNARAILQAAEQHECQAIHPGYGFLAENAVFAARCEQHGIAFIGPGSGAIRRLGNKIEAKRLMAAAGLAGIPGSDGPVTDVAHASSEAQRVGYPVILKAAAGGGGRGMRACADRAALTRGFDEAAREAEAAFGNPEIYLEKLVAGGRHVEIQVLGDVYGAFVHLGDRECSIQRQHQKLVEESPAPAVEAGARSILGAKVCRALAAIGYRNAGTVEFLRTAGGELLFMEVNTRLQVEHPVTELVTGIDLVVEQLRSAAGERLGLVQEGIEYRGHAIEFRINAEDPDNGFKPDPGEITAVSLGDPPPGVRVRWDSAARPGYRVTPHYDSLIGKLIVHAADRARALEGAREVLGAMRIEGVRTTLPLHRRIVSDPRFVRGNYDVDFLAPLGLAGKGASSPAGAS
jgi:acetyl-CoA carboxylase biotin carboxylase subunit